MRDTQSVRKHVDLRKRILTGSRMRQFIQKPGLLVLLAVSVALSAQAQKTSGFLAKSHAMLSGPERCAECHDLFQNKPEFKCLNCHWDAPKNS